MIQLVCKTDVDCMKNGTAVIEGATCVDCICISEMAGTCGEDSGKSIFVYLNQVFFNINNHYSFFTLSYYFILECTTDEHCQEGLDPDKMKAWCDKDECVCMIEEMPNLDEY